MQKHCEDSLFASCASFQMPTKKNIYKGKTMKKCVKANQRFRTLHLLVNQKKKKKQRKSACKQVLQDVKINRPPN